MVTEIVTEEDTEKMSVRLLFPTLLFKYDLIEEGLLTSEYVDQLRQDMDAMRRKDPTGRRVSNAYTGWQSNDGCNERPIWQKVIRVIKDKAKFLKVGGIMIGNDVKLSGVKVGVVSDVRLDEDYFAEVVFKVYSEVKVPEEVAIEVASDGILGNKYLSLSPLNRDSKTYLKENNEIRNVKDFESIEDQVSKIIFLATQ